MRRSEVRGRKSEVGSQRSEVRGRKSEVRSQKSDLPASPERSDGGQGEAIPSIINQQSSIQRGKFMKNINTGKEICSFLKKKLSLFNRYLSITKRMKQTLNDKEPGNLGGLASERQDCINKIERISLSMEKIGKGRSGGEGLIHGYLKNIRYIMETIAPIDRELMVMVREQGESIKTELLKMRNVRQAAQGYRNEGRYSPRFLDTKR